MYTKDNPLRVVTLCSGYDSQCMALDRIKQLNPDFDYDLIAWSEIDKYAIQAHDAVYPQWKDRNLGDMTKIDWDKVKGDIDLLFYSTPCLTADSLILTKSGYKPIVDVKVGEEVLTKSSIWHKVVKKFDNGQHPTCYITGMGFDAIHCTLNHKFYTRKRQFIWDAKKHNYKRVFEEPDFVEARDLDRSYYLGMPIDTTSQLPKWNGVELHRGTHWDRVNTLSALMSNPSFWYLMGRYVGDGWIRDDDKHKGITICCSYEEADKLADSIKVVGFPYTKVNEKTVVKFTINSKELCEFVKRYGRYAWGKRIDGETMLLPADLLEQFLNGAIDSDGCWTNNKYKIATVSRELAYGYAFCISKVYKRPWSFDICRRANHYTIQGRVVNQRDSYTVAFTPDSRKQDHAFVEDGYIWYPFGKRIMGDIENVFNMEIETDHSYIVQGCISKNCQDFSQAGKQSGATEGSGTRSSILWYTRNAIVAKRPKYCIMENVKAVVSDKFKSLFNKWEQELASYGYTNYCKVLNAKDYGIPQNRERIFLVSILDETESFRFGEPFELELRLKDMLEQKVDEKYYLSDEKVNSFIEHCDRKQAEGCGFKFEPTDGGGASQECNEQGWESGNRQLPGV